MPDTKNDGLIHTPSTHSIADTLQRLETLLESKGLTIFARVDHSGEAAKVGMQMRPTQLLIFGSPKGGTPLMQAAPTVAIDLPLKALVWEDEHGRVWVTHNSPEYLQKRHGFPQELVKNIAGAAALIQKGVE